MSVIPYKAKEVAAAAKYAVNPDLFCLKSNLDVPMNQTISVIDTYQDVIFSNTSLLLNGNFAYDGDKVTYIGLDDIDCTLNMSCSVTSTVINTIVHIGQDKNGVIDPGSETSAKLESNTGTASLNFATHFSLITGDTLNLQIKSDKLATIGIEHFQVVLQQAIDNV